jgi:hypothetical protein
MKTRILAALLVVVASPPWTAAAKEKELGRPPALIGWLDLQSGSRNISVFKEDLQKVTPHLAQGAPGTVTIGEVTFHPIDNGQKPVWKRKADFFVFGRDNAVESVKIEKTCPWDGRGFTPLQ